MFRCVDLREITVLWCFTDYAGRKPKYLLRKHNYSVIVANLYKPCWQKTNSVPLETFLSFTEELEDKDIHTNRWVLYHIASALKTVACLTHTKLIDGTYFYWVAFQWVQMNHEKNKCYGRASSFTKNVSCLHLLFYRSPG